MEDSLKPYPDGVTVQLSSQQYNDLIMRVLRLENYIMQNQRDVLIKNLCVLEDTFQIPRTKEKRTR